MCLLQAKAINEERPGKVCKTYQFFCIHSKFQLVSSNVCRCFIFQTLTYANKLHGGEAVKKIDLFLS